MRDSPPGSGQSAEERTEMNRVATRYTFLKSVVSYDLVTYEWVKLKELIVTGHADGSVRFWDTSSTTMLSLYRIKTLKYFEKAKPSSTPPSSAETGSLDSDPYAITQVRNGPAMTDECPTS